MDGRANVGNDNISRQKVGLEALMLDAARAAVTPISAKAKRPALRRPFLSPRHRASTSVVAAESELPPIDRLMVNET